MLLNVANVVGEGLGGWPFYILFSGGLFTYPCAWKWWQMGSLADRMATQVEKEQEGETGSE